VSPPTVAYLRVSSRSQTIATQRDAIERAATARGERVVTWYSETESAKRLARPELERLRRDARGGRLGRLYVYRLDRLSRTGIRDTLALVHEFRAHGVELVSLGDGFDLAGPAADLVIAVMAWAAEMERLRIGERISDARKRVEGAGGHWGRPRAALPLGAVPRALALRSQGISMREVARRLGVPRNTLTRALAAQNPPPVAGPQGAKKTRA